jgi:3-isopropylmalate/(R)-2-methylmalate dehydratase small subunit
VLSSRFADIFSGNAGKGGLVAAVLDQSDIEALWAAIEDDPAIALTLDLESRTVSWGSTSVSFEIDDYTRWRLLEGLDDIDLTLRHADEIAEFERQRPAWMPATG